MHNFQFLVLIGEMLSCYNADGLITATIFSSVFLVLTFSARLRGGQLQTPSVFSRCHENLAISVISPIL